MASRLGSGNSLYQFSNRPTVPNNVDTDLQSFRHNTYEIDNISAFQLQYIFIHHSVHLNEMFIL
jgi:hypothetical protein